LSYSHRRLDYSNCADPVSETEDRFARVIPKTGRQIMA